MAGPAPEGPQTHNINAYLWMFGNGALASCIAEAATLPLEVTKMRLQLQKNNKDPLKLPRYSGMVDAFKSIVRQEKWFSLFKGLEAGMHKQILYTGLRLGLYDHLTAGEGSVSIPEKIAFAGLTTGIGIAVANPADLIQTKYIAWRQSSMSDPLHSVAAPAAESTQPRATILANKAAGSQPGPSGGSSRGTASGLDSHRSPYPTRSFMSTPSGRPCAGGLTGNSQFFSGHPSVSCISYLSRGKAGCSASHFGGAHVSGHLARFGRRFLARATMAQNSDVAPGPRTITGVPLQNARRAYFIIVREEGLLGLYRGFWANFMCSCVQGATEIACYDVTKNMMLERGAVDGMPVHLAAGVDWWGVAYSFFLLSSTDIGADPAPLGCRLEAVIIQSVMCIVGMCAGLLSTLLSNPFDVVATRMMAAKKASAAQRSTVQEVLKIARREGVLAFYQGFGPNVLRVGSYNVILWLTYEQLRVLTSP